MVHRQGQSQLDIPTTIPQEVILPASNKGRCKYTKYATSPIVSPIAPADEELAQFDC